MTAKHNHSLSPVSITFSEEVASGIYLIGFPRNFEFEAGQVIGIALEENGARRLYSICSGEEDQEIQILYNVIEEGYLTRRLSWKPEIPSGLPNHVESLPAMRTVPYGSPQERVLPLSIPCCDRVRARTRS